jgi:hypothetical protein
MNDEDKEFPKKQGHLGACAAPTVQAIGFAPFFMAWMPKMRSDIPPTSRAKETIFFNMPLNDRWIKLKRRTFRLCIGHRTRPSAARTVSCPSGRRGRSYYRQSNDEDKGQYGTLECQTHERSWVAFLPSEIP